MSDFNLLRDAVKTRLDQIINLSGGELFVVDVNKDQLWETYLSSFPEGTNPIFKERTEHDCNCCKQFIKGCGGVVAIVNNKLHSIWKVAIDDSTYQPVADALDDLVTSSNVVDVFRHFEGKVGAEKTHSYEDEGVVEWTHFNYKLPRQFIMEGKDQPSFLSDKRANYSVLKRSLEEITVDSCEVVSELISQNSLYRGEEHGQRVKDFLKYKKAYIKLQSDSEKDNFAWVVSSGLGGMSKIRNTSIGTLLVDLSGDVDLEVAVKKFEDKVSGTNYKRPKALITKGMIKKAEEDVKKLGFEGSLQRRYAVNEDITINNVIFANREAKQAMSVFDQLSSDTKPTPKKFDKVEEISIEDFISNVVPKCEKIEVLFEGKHKSNLMSLISPEDKDSKCMLKWGNNYSWTYYGEVADSIKENVKSAGGNVEGFLRFSIQWNEEGDNNVDFDAHCYSSLGHISYLNKKALGGKLDVDIIDPRGKVAVENIFWVDEGSIPKGELKFYVKNYSNARSRAGFKAQMECNGKIYDFSYNNTLSGKEEVTVARVKYTKSNGLEFLESLDSSATKQEVWNINTEDFANVKMIMHSPNHWDGNCIGNKHYFFMLEDCLNPEDARGFYNEFLDESLSKHRKVFEVLGSKLKAPYSENQLSGLGFSTTKRNHAYFRVTGSIKRTLKVVF